MKFSFVYNRPGRPDAPPTRLVGTPLMLPAAAAAGCCSMILFYENMNLNEKLTYLFRKYDSFARIFDFLT